MTSKRLRWIFYFSLPFALLALPFTTHFSWGKYFNTIVLQPQKTGITTFQYNDEKRGRPLVTEVWYPVDIQSPSQAALGFWMRCDEARDVPMSTKKAQYPLIMMSHGSGGDRYTISWLAEVLASNGYIVAAMDHYGNTWNNKIPELYIQPWERPADISFVLDQLLNDSWLKEHIDLSRIGFAGYSLGGATGIWVAGAEAAHLDAASVKKYASQDLEGIISLDLVDTMNFEKAKHSYRDPRISAAVVMAPALGWVFDEQSLKNIDIPIFIIAPENDLVVPTEMNAKVFAKKIAKATLKILPGEATHYVFLNRATVVGKRFLDKRYCEDPASIDRKKIHDFIAKNSVDFFNKQLQ